MAHVSELNVYRYVPSARIHAQLGAEFEFALTL